MAGIFGGFDEEESEDDENRAKRQRLATQLTEEDKRLVTLALRGVDVMEIVSPERVTRVCRAFQLQPGDALDLTNGWDLSRVDHRRRALELRAKRKPFMVICSPPCTRFSNLNNLNVAVHGAEWERCHLEERRKAVEHLKFSALFMKLQHRDGKYFLFEHPAGANSWEVAEIQQVMNLPGTEWRRADLCQYGLTTRGEDGVSQIPAKKPTGFMSNSRFVLRELGRTCSGYHAHQPLMGGRARAAQEYTIDLCRAICKGIRDQKKYDQSGKASTSAMTASELKCFVQRLCRLETKQRAPGLSRKLAQEHRRHLVNQVLTCGVNCDSGASREKLDDRQGPTVERSAPTPSVLASAGVGNDMPRPPEESIVGYNRHDTNNNRNVDNNHNDSAKFVVDGREWADQRHEEDGTNPEHIDSGNGDESNRESITADDSALGGAHPYFRTGTNTGAKLMSDAMMALTQGKGGWVAYDDISGEALCLAGVRAARALEMKYFENMKVYTRVPRAQGQKSGKGKIIKGRWLDVNKGDSEQPDYRSRFVGKEFNTGAPDASLFAATPPLEALKLLVSEAATDMSRKTHIMRSDVKRAYFTHRPRVNCMSSSPQRTQGMRKGSLAG